MSAAPTPSSADAASRRHGLSIDPQTRRRFRALFARAERDPGGRGLRAIGRWVGRLRDALPGAHGARAASPTRDLVAAWLPQVAWAPWSDDASLSDALPVAARALERAEAALAALRRDLQLGDLPPLDAIEAAAASIADATIANPDALAWLARPRGRAGETCSHGLLCATHLAVLGRRLGLPRELLARLALVGLLADAGMQLLPPEVVLRAGRPTAADALVIREHVLMGLSALGGSTRLAPEVRDGIAQHHERLDGSGYPEGLRGSAVGIWGRMAAVVDAYVALASRRPGSRPVAPQDALMHLLSQSGARFYEPLVEQFAQAIGPFPVGSLVELASGEVAAVLERDAARPLRPRLLVLTDARRQPLARPLELDLRHDARAASTGPAADPGRRVKRGLHAGAHGLWAPDFFEASPPASASAPADAASAARAA